MHLSPVYHSPFHIIHSAPKSRRSTFPEYYFEVNFQQDWSTGTQTQSPQMVYADTQTHKERERDRQTDRQTALYIRCGKAIDSDKPTTYYTLNLSMSSIKFVP
jgi:hypothetical protein